MFYDSAEVVGVSLETTIELGVLAIIGLGLLFGVVQAVLSYLAQRNLNDLHSMGMQAIIAVNELQIVDESLEKRDENQ